MRLSYEPQELRRITAPADFGRVAVLFGGDSSEREISLLSGNAVLAALKRRSVDAHAFDPRDQDLAQLLTQGFARVWIALHGPGGEDGTLQGALEYLGVPYTGSGVMGSAIGMDKLRTKRLALSVGVPTADFVVLSRESVYTTNFMKYGFTPGMGATYVLPKKLGFALAEEMLISARTYRGAELERRGVPFPVLPRAEVLAYARQLATEIAEKPRISLVTLKAHLVREVRQELGATITREVEMHEKTMHQPDVRERIERTFGR